MRTPIEEREVSIQFMTDSNIAHVYTSDYSYMTKLDKLCEKNPTEWKIEYVNKNEGDIVGKQYTCPRKLISFRANTTKREMTDEQRLAAAERLKVARTKKNSKKQ